MNLAFCYPSVLPARGGCETYIADLARRLVRDGHEVHLYACRWEASALPSAVHVHPLSVPRGPRFLRPWRFGAACARALDGADHDVSVGFDKTWGLDVLYPQGGLHTASARYNLRKFRRPVSRGIARLLKGLDLAHWSYSLLERRQYRAAGRPLIVVNSHMVQRHFETYHAIDPDTLRVIPSAIDPGRFGEDTAAARGAWRAAWGIGDGETAALFIAMNYRLKGLDPLLHALRRLTAEPLRLLVVGNARTRPYERLARRLGVGGRVRFLGPRRDIQHCYAAADFLVHPTFYDPCSLVVLEALACGLPVITSRYNGARELLSPPHEGYEIDDPHDHEQLAWCMRQMLDAERRARCARAARYTAEQWTFEHHYQEILGVFAEAAARKKAPVAAPGREPAAPAPSPQPRPRPAASPSPGAG